ncbi:MAG: hypothetical protein U0793_34175 [Gemmataceae bacterium]
MNAARQLELRASLRRELERQSQERLFSGTDRVAWLLAELDNYIERWLGLFALNYPEATGGPSDDLFCMIEIGSEIIGDELHRVESLANAEGWREFLAVLAAVRAGHGLVDPTQLASKLRVFRAEFSA